MPARSAGRIQRDADPAQPLINYIDRGFLNRDNETVRGVDANVTFDTTLTVFERPVDLSLDVRGHRQIERSTLYVNDAGEPDFNAYHREWGYPERKAQIALRIGYDRWRFSWQTRYQSRVIQDVAAIDEFNDIYDSQKTGRSNTCLGPPDDLLCRDFGVAGEYWLHHASVGYRSDTLQLGAGVRNVFDEWPPQVDDSERWTTWNNTPRGDGYDFVGRTYFIEASYRFGGE